MEGVAGADRGKKGQLMDRAMAQAYGNRTSEEATPGVSPFAGATLPVVLVLEQHERLSRGYGHLFDYLGIRLARVRAGQALAAAVRAEQPMAILWSLDADGFDACQVLATIAEHDRTLPILVVAGKDARTVGIVEALEELWGFSEVHKFSGNPELQEVVEFLFRAGRKNGTCRMLSV